MNKVNSFSRNGILYAAASLYVKYSWSRLYLARKLEIAMSMLMKNSTRELCKKKKRLFLFYVCEFLSTVDTYVHA